VELTSSKHNKVSAVLRQELQSLLIIEVDQLITEVLANHLLLDGEFVLAYVGYFQEHGGCHIDAVKGLEVDGQMRRHLDLSLFLFIWLVLSLTIALQVELGQTVFKSRSLALKKNVIGLIEKS